MSFSFLFPDSGLSFKQLYVHPVSPIKMRRNTLVSPKRVQVYIQRETRQTLERKTPAHPRRLRAGTDKVCCLSGKKHFQVQKWRNSVKRFGEIPGGEWSRSGRATRSQHFCSNPVGFLRQTNSPVDPARSESDGTGKPSDGADARGSLGSERETGAGHATSGWQQAAHIWGRVASPENVLGGKLGHVILCKTQNFYAPPFPHLENNDSVPLTHWAARR